METHILSVDEQYLIRKIAKRSVAENPSLDFAKSYIITLLYYLAQYCDYKVDTIPDEYREDVQILYKKPESSYTHYITNIQLSNKQYPLAIKSAELKIKGDDPLCPWS